MEAIADQHQQSEHHELPASGGALTTPMAPTSTASGRR